MTAVERAREWARFAEMDLKSAEVLFKAGIFNEVCFHAQQCVEKMLKAFLISKDEAVPKTHRLLDLLEVALKYGTNMEKMRQSCLILDQYYIPTRYPDAVIGSKTTGLPIRKEGEEALRLADSIFEEIKSVLNFD